MLVHPFEWLTETGRKRALWLLLPLTSLVMFCLQRIGVTLVTQAAPYGIVSFELAGSLARAYEMRISWPPGSTFYAGLSLGLDYLYMPLYAASIALSCVLIAQQSVIWLRTVGTLLAWGQFVAGALDAIENYALIKVLLGEQAALWPMLARSCAIPKFILVGLGLLFVLLVGLLRIGQRMVGNKDNAVEP